MIQDKTTPHICDLAVIGAGPAGMAAATTAAKAGLSVVLLDEGEGPGGQIYRSIEGTTPARAKVLGADYNAGAALARALREADLTYLPRSTVWNISTDRVVDFSRDGGSSQLQAGFILVATGALERPSPIPGWTKPGVTTVGALQILLKSAGIVEEDAALAGSGPLLWLVAKQMIDAGAPPVAVVETTPRGRMSAALPHLAGALKGHRYLRKGLSMMRAVRRAGVPVHPAASGLEVMGDAEATGLRFTSKGRTHEIRAAHVALHQGVVPNQQVTRMLRCEHHWDAAQYCFRPVVDARGLTSVENVYTAGDGAGIMGAVSAALQGRLAALDIASKLGKSAPERADRLEAALTRDGAVRPFLEALYAPAEEFVLPGDGVTVCRCEEITAGAIREAVDLGAPGPNQVKSFLRSGMGPCQGRVCGLVVANIIAERRHAGMDDTGYFRIRPPLKPMQLSELAQFKPLEKLEP
ncbi:(2Fe-2S)-binding protein [Salipiger profundus]|uniref:Thioredoxin reductase n=2 Tax=Salipiger profundus TaxID=1229727 RepID=A0A1U7D9B0_9RHOB|nr:NAD(P)/FAD-dependent oxidoreductase [Salipiger profundus]APX24754.1 thioredoxin reductase [Salipiger profundus]GFZ97529.1 (2Fe-2S)-binding protein [Salipiger profundus]SFD00208.1 Thioredoxin reductase [Salipiger profundus]